MIEREMHWIGIDKIHLPRMLLGGHVGETERIWSVEPPIHRTGIIVGFKAEELQGLYRATPSVIVIADELMVETLSWLKAFAPETSPLSQFARVLSYSDWQSFSRAKRDGRVRRGELRSDPASWACVILGELLGQSDGTSKLSAIPLAHAASCFSMTLARTELLHEPRQVIGMCIKRLQSLESEKRLTRRTLSLDDLMPVWELLSVPRPLNPDAVTTVDYILQESSSFVKIRSRHGQSMISYVGAESGLLSDSIEQRVKAFQMLLMRLSAEYSEPSELTPNLLAAAGAFLVGRSASHFFLLQRVKERWPAAMAWFSVIASAGGPELWDSEWARAVKGIERLLRSGLDDTGVSAADLSWAEYAWLRQVFDGPEVFGDLPKMQARTLSVEVVPGAPCQFRLAGDSGAHSVEPERAVINQMGARIRELENLVESFVSLASRSRQVLADHSFQEKVRPSPRGQVTFHFDRDEPSPSKPTRRTTKRST